MALRNPLIGVAAALGLLLSALIIQRFQLWSALASYTVPWFCSTVAIALLLVTMTSWLSGCTPAQIPISRAATVVVGVALATGVGMLLDGISYGSRSDYASSIGEAIGFVAVTAVLFWIPRTEGTTSAPSGESDH